VRHDISPEGVEGWMSPEAGALLTKMASQIPEGGLIVELGSYHGKSLMFLALGAAARKGHVISIDFPPAHRQFIEETVRKFEAEDLVQIITGKSVEMAPRLYGQVIDLLFIDANHFEVKQDIETYLPLMNPSGVIMFHDFGSKQFPDVEKDVVEAFPDWQERTIGKVHLLLALRLGERQ